LAPPPKVEDLRLWCDFQYTVLGLMEHAKPRRSWVRCGPPAPGEADDSSTRPGHPVALEGAVGPLLGLLSDQQPADWKALETEIGRLRGTRCEDSEVLSQEDLGRMTERAWAAMRAIGNPVPPEEINVKTIAAARRALDIVKNWIHHHVEDPAKRNSGGAGGKSDHGPPAKWMRQVDALGALEVKGYRVNASALSKWANKEIPLFRVRTFEGRREVDWNTLLAFVISREPDAGDHGDPNDGSGPLRGESPRDRMEQMRKEKDKLRGNLE
jgi:hypothetical protein